MASNMEKEDMEAFEAILEQNKDLKEALNNQLDKVFVLQDENQTLKDRIEELEISLSESQKAAESRSRVDEDDLRLSESVKNSFLKLEKELLASVDQSTQTQEFDDPFEKELVNDMIRRSETTFRFSLSQASHSRFGSIRPDLEPIDGMMGVSEVGNNVLNSLDGAEKDNFSENQKSGFLKESGENRTEIESDGQLREELAQQKALNDEMEEKMAKIAEEIIGLNKTNMRLKKDIQGFREEAERWKGEAEKHIGLLGKRDQQLQETKDELLKIGNLVNEVDFADNLEIKVSLDHFRHFESFSPNPQPLRLEKVP